MEVMVCFGVRYLNAIHFAIDFKCPFRPRANRNPAWRLLRSGGLLNMIQDVSIPVASREIVSPAATPAWKKAQPTFSSVKTLFSAETVVLEGFIKQLRLNPGIGNLSVTRGNRALRYSKPRPATTAKVLMATICARSFWASRRFASDQFGSGTHLTTDGFADWTSLEASAKRRSSRKIRRVMACLSISATPSKAPNDSVSNAALQIP
jgi:hypothetical protein